MTIVLAASHTPTDWFLRWLGSTGGLHRNNYSSFCGYLHRRMDDLSPAREETCEQLLEAQENAQEKARAKALAKHKEEVKYYAEALRLMQTQPQVPFPKRDGERTVFFGRATRVFPTGTRVETLGSTVTRTSGGASGAVVGGLLAGPVGAIAGYAASKKTSVTEPPRTYESKTYYSDAGLLCVTSTRVIFIGDKDAIELPLEAVLHVSANKREGYAGSNFDLRYRHGRHIGENTIRFKYMGAPSDEHFIVENYVYFTLALSGAGSTLPHSTGQPTP